MKKLSLEDIEILHPGKQMKKAVLEQYKSVEEFALKTGMNLNSIKVYFRSKPYGSKQFRIKLVTILGKDYNDIVLDNEKQIKLFVATIIDNITEYKQEEDIVILDKVREYCLKCSLEEEASKMYKAIGLHYCYVNHAIKGIDHINHAINMIKESKNKSLLASHYIDLVKVYYQNGQYEKATEFYNIINEFLDMSEFDNRTYFQYYYRLGLLYNKKQHDLAREFFIKSLKYARLNQEIGSAQFNIAITYNRQNQLYKALDNYNIAVNKFDKDDFERLSTVMNNIADIYVKLGNLKKAELYIEKAFEYLKDKSIEKKFVYLRTYVRVKPLTGNSEIVEELFRLIKTSNDYYMDKTYIIDSIKDLASLFKDNKNLLYLNKLIRASLELAKSNLTNKELYKSLIQCIGFIYLYIDEIENREV